jgi:hypothetical protein
VPNISGGNEERGCASRTVNQVLADPPRYRDREVQLSGAVVDSYSFVNRGAYRIDHGTGQLWVVSDKACPARARGSPSQGRFVRDSILAHWAAGSTCRKELDRTWC